MPISELYVIRHLLEETNTNRCVWRRNEAKGYQADKNDLGLTIASAPSNIGSRCYLTICDRFHSVHIAEPVPRGIIRDRYDKPDQQELAEAMKELVAAITSMRQT